MSEEKKAAPEPKQEAPQPPRKGGYTIPVQMF